MEKGKSYEIGSLGMRNDESFSKSDLKIKNECHLSPFAPQNCRKWAKSGISSLFYSFFWPKRGQMLFDLNFEARFGVLSSFGIS